MKNQETKIAVYSRASALVNTLKSEQKNLHASGSMRLDYVFRESSKETQGLEDVEAIIYDLSIVNGDATQAAANILHLKVESGNKPLILIGSRQALEEALASPRIKPEVAYTIAKPMSGSQLRLVSEAVVIKHRLSHLPAQSNMSTPARVAASVAIVVGLAFAISAFWMSTTISLEAEANNARVELLVEPVSEPAQRSSDANSTAADALIKLASLAVLQKRLAFPANDNALYYFDQILELDSYHQDAYRGRQHTLKALDGSLAIHMSDGNFVEAEKLLKVLLDAEPFNDQYRRIDLALRSQKYASRRVNDERPTVTADIAKATSEDSTNTMFSD